MTVATVPPHEAFVQGAAVDVTVTLDEAVDAAKVQLVQASNDYTLGSIAPDGKAITLVFHPEATGLSATQLKLSDTEQAPLRGQGKFPIEFERAALNVGDVLVQTSEAAGFVARNHTGNAVQLELEGADPSAFALSPAQLPPFGFPVFVRVDFKPDQARPFSATVTQDFDRSGPSVDLSGTGVTQIEDGAIQKEFDPGNDGVATPDEATRFSVFVPRHDSHFNMGTPDNREGGVKVEGIGLKTDRDILLAATGDTSRVGVVATSDVIVQSTTRDVFTLGKERNIMASSGSSFVLGDGGVLIATLTEGSLAEPDAQGLPSPRLDSDGKPSTIKAATGVGMFLGILDATVALGLANVNRLRFKQQRSPSPLIGAAMGVAAAGVAALGVAGQVPGVTIYGHAGLLMGTFGFGSFYAAGGMVLSSALPLLLGVDTEIVGLDSLSLWGGLEASVTGANEARLFSHGKVSITADGQAPPNFMSGPRARRWFPRAQGDVEIEAAHEIDARVTHGYELNMTADQVTVARPPVQGPLLQGVQPPPPSGDLAVGPRVVRCTVANVRGDLRVTTLTLTDGRGTGGLITAGITMTGANREAATRSAGISS
ncbi:MAG: hypothetical protein AB7K71_37480, partial [Polyangiaceae bacterium]